MKEKHPVQLNFIGEAPGKRDFCYIAPAPVASILTSILNLEQRLSEGNLSSSEYEAVVHDHIIAWSKLPDYYKSELSDLTAITL